MGNLLIDLGQARESPQTDLPLLSAYVSQLIGEPYQFARITYGDELTLHFGSLRPARSPRLKDKRFGSYILGLQASSWVLKSGAKPALITSLQGPESSTPSPGQLLSKEDLETGDFIQPGSRVLSATPFVVEPLGAFGLQLRMSDGSSLVIRPETSEPDEPEDEGLPELADWELSSRQGLLSAGPRLMWTFAPRKP